MSDRAGVPGSYDEDIAREPEVTLLRATPIPATTPEMTLTGCQCCGLSIRRTPRPSPGRTKQRDVKVWLHIQTGLEICPARAAMASITRPEPAGQDDFYEVTVTVKMTSAQRDEYRAEYGSQFSVADDIASRLRADVSEALASCYWLREFATCSVSKPR